MAYNTWADVDPRAQRITVYFENADSDTIREGMPLCYNHDTTTNWSGVTRADGTESTTTAEGSQNEGKWIRTEVPSANNRMFFAGVVAKGSKGIGLTSASEVDIYLANGAIVPVYTDRSVTIGEKAYLENSENTMVNVPSNAAVGIFMETIDRSGTAGLALVKLDGPEKVDYYATGSVSLGSDPSPLIWADCPIEQLRRMEGGYIHERDFLDEIDVTNADGWEVTAATTGSINSIIGEGGILQAAAGASTADQGVNAQLLNCSVKPQAGTTIWFEARFQVSHIDNQIYVGLASTDTTLIASGALDETNPSLIGFFTDVNSTTGTGGIVASKAGSNETQEDVLTVAATTYYTVGFKINGVTSITFYQNGAAVGTVVTDTNDIPVVDLCLSLVCQNEDGANSNTMNVDWVRLAQNSRP